MNQLSQFDNFVYERAITMFRPTRAVLSQSFKLLQNYCEYEQVSFEMMPMMAEISTFIAQSSQQIRDLKGRKVKGMGLALSRLIGNCKSISLLIDQISKFISIVLLDPNHKNEIQSYLHKARATNEFMRLFQSYVNKMSLVQADGIQNIKYKEAFIQIAWILFIDCRENCIKINTDAKEENNCLLASVFYFMIRYSMEHFYPQQLNVDINDEKRVVIGRILQFLLNTFQIQQIDLYMKIADQFDEYIEKLINSSQLISINAETNFFSPAIISFNLKQLQNKYQKRLQSKDIDYRVFRKQKSFTPIRKQVILHRAGAANTQASNSQMNNPFRSHRALNYDDNESPLNDENLKLKINSKLQIKNKCDGRITKITNPQIQTHFSTFFANKKAQVPEGLNKQIYQYINRLSKPANGQSFQFLESLRQIYETVLGKDLPTGCNCEKSFCMSIYSVFNHACGRIQNNDLESEQIQKCILSLSLFVVYQMYNQNQHKKTISDYFRILNGQNFIELWYCLNMFGDSDENIPIKLLDMIKEDQTSIITSLIWQNNDYIDEVAQLAANYNKDTKFVQFTQSMIEYIENFIFKMYEQLNISINQANHAYNCMKFILSANGNILQNRNIDQILCCSIYIAGRVLRIESSVLFTQIREAYLKIFKNRSGDLDDIFNKVFSPLGSNENIISFYNNYFIECVSPFAPYMANPQVYDQFRQLSLLHHLFQKKIQFLDEQSTQTYYPINMLNIMETTKHKSKKDVKKTKDCVFENNEGIRIIYESQRNQTRLRIRPNQSKRNQLCETQRGKSHYQDAQGETNNI